MGRNRSPRSGAAESVSLTGSTKTITTAAAFGSSRGYKTHSDEFPIGTGTEWGLLLEIPCTPCYPYAGKTAGGWGFHPQLGFYL